MVFQGNSFKPLMSRQIQYCLDCCRLFKEFFSNYFNKASGTLIPKCKKISHEKENHSHFRKNNAKILNKS